MGDTVHPGARAGDAISFDSTTPHRLSNRGTIAVRAVWFVSGRTLADDAAGG